MHNGDGAMKLNQKNVIHTVKQTKSKPTET